jgi:hypothetical protein
MFWMILIVLLIIGFCSMISDSNKAFEKDKRDKEWLKKVYEDNNLDDILAKAVVYNLPTDDLEYKKFIYTNDKRIFYIYVGKRVVEINPKSVLAINVNLIVQERNVQKLISLTPTFNNISSVVGVNLELITENGTYSGRFGSGSYTIDTVKKFKLILERDLKLRSY